MNEQLANKLLGLVQINSFTNNVEGVNSVGECIKELLNDIPLSWESFSAEGKNATNFGKMLFAKSQNWNDTKPKIFLCGHMDTVFNNHEGFNIRVEDDIVYGPGTMDMKGGLLVMIEVIRELYKRNKLENVALLFMPEEE